MHGGCNASTAVEDAFVLGNLFSYLSNPRQIPSLLHAYQEIREPQAAHVQALEFASRMVLISPLGPALEARNAAFAETLKSDGELGDEMLSQLWDGYVGYYNYDTLEAVEDWWTKVSHFVFWLCC